MMLKAGLGQLPATVKRRRPALATAAATLVAGKRNVIEPLASAFMLLLVTVDEALKSGFKDFSRGSEHRKVCPMHHLRCRLLRNGENAWVSPELCLVSWSTRFERSPKSDK